ncbi:MAG: hypothetical protein M5U34_35870 [Chloroflexi bacterium]|nr:hypothetical protein [Chloroflexota bacterium]
MREQATLLEISQTLASALALEPGLILDQLQVIVEYTHAVLFGLNDLTLLTLAVQGPQSLKEAVPSRIQLDGPESLAALLNGHAPQRIADVWGADPAAQFLRSFLNDQAAVLLDGIRAWMWVPPGCEGARHRGYRRCSHETGQLHRSPCRSGADRRQPGRHHHGQCPIV